ncbi:hypothetical protein Pan216_07440 [Planctomycetes bacterium Pan216]|uniref:PAAR motif protein n=1 Tax=Kolteria novifilia TaxID=2527975 RepID=A0A518AYV6_9BACT|nr:hypothetical protein Pan216_07440 [Planctomycetes bacterium Pan216]
MSMYAFTGTETMGAVGPGVVMSEQPIVTYCGLPFATQGMAQDMTVMGPGVYTVGDPMTCVMGMGMVFLGLPSTMGNIVGPSGADYMFG